MNCLNRTRTRKIRIKKLRQLRLTLKKKVQNKKIPRKETIITQILDNNSKRKHNAMEL